MNCSYRAWGTLECSNTPGLVEGFTNVIEGFATAVLPPGSYLDTCTGCMADDNGRWLGNCSCPDESGNMRPVPQFSVVSCFGKDVTNYHGTLSCRPSQPKLKPVAIVDDVFVPTIANTTWTYSFNWTRVILKVTGATKPYAYTRTVGGQLVDSGTLDGGKGSLVFLDEANGATIAITGYEIGSTMTLPTGPVLTRTA